MTEPSRVDVVTAFLVNDDGRVLLLRRSESVRTYKGQWGAVSGYLETYDPLLQAEREIREETGVGQDVHVRKRGSPIVVDDPDNAHFWRVHPFHFYFGGDESDVALSREHDEFEWVEPDRIRDRKTVPKLYETWEQVRP